MLIVRPPPDRADLPSALEHPPARAAGDELWATTFGAPNVAAYPSVIAVRGEDVYLGGDFTVQMAGMPDDTYVRVAHWNDSGWQRLGDGVDATVRAIAVVGDDVYAGGDFTMAGGMPAPNLARWDGTAWFAVAGGVSSSQPAYAASARALASDGEKLYVAGDGGLWSAAQPGEAICTLTVTIAVNVQIAPKRCRALARPGDRLYVGGSFDRAGTVETASLAVLDLATTRWQGFGVGMRSDDFTGTVDSLAVDEATGTVFIGGRFTTATP